MKNMNLREMTNCETNEMWPALATKNELAHQPAARNRWKCIFGGVMQTVQLLAWLFMFQVTQRQVCFAGASAHASSDSWVYQPHKADDSSDSWRLGRYQSAAKAQMRWISGEYEVGKENDYCREEKTQEDKFGKDKNGYPTPLKFTGFNDTCEYLGSWVNGRGVGSSTVNYDWHYPFRAEWHVGVTGRLPGHVLGYYAGYAAGDDPWPITAQDFESAPDGFVDLFIPLEIQGGSFGNEFGGQSYIGFNVSYQTAGGTSDLLEITISGNGTSVTPGAIGSSSVELYEMTYDPTSGLSAPSTLPSQLLQPSMLRTQLEQDLQPGQEPGTTSLEHPMYVGVVVRNVPIPGLPLADGSLAEIGVASFAYDSALSPTASQR